MGSDLIMSIRLWSCSLNCVPTVGLRPAMPAADVSFFGAAGFLPFAFAFLAVSDQREMGGKETKKGTRMLTLITLSENCTQCLSGTINDLELA